VSAGECRRNPGRNPALALISFSGFFLPEKKKPLTSAEERHVPERKDFPVNTKLPINSKQINGSNFFQILSVINNYVSFSI